MENIIEDSNVSQGFNEEQPSNSYSVDLDSLFNETQEQFGNVEGSEQPQEIEIDERFIGLDPQEAKYRTYQSRYDKIQADYNKLQSQYASIEEKARLIDEMIQDPDMLVAFVNEINPNLVQKPDRSSYVKNKLKEEFGEGYKPTLSRDEAEREDPGGTDWTYYKRLDQLYNEIGGKQQKAMSVKERKEQLAKQQKEQIAKQQMEVAKVQKQYGMDDNEVKAMVDFYSNLSLDQTVKIWRLLRRQPQTKNNLNLVSGSPNSGMSPQFQDFMKSLNYRK